MESHCTAEQNHAEACLKFDAVDFDKPVKILGEFNLLRWDQRWTLWMYFQNFAKEILCGLICSEFIACVDHLSRYRHVVNSLLMPPLELFKLKKKTLTCSTLIYLVYIFMQTLISRPQAMVAALIKTCAMLHAYAKKAWANLFLFVVAKSYTKTLEKFNL